MLKYKLIGNSNNDYIIDPVDTVFENRNVQNKDKFLNPSIKDTYDYKLLKNIGEATECIIKHVKNNSKIHIQIDCDDDGYTSAAIMYLYLKLIKKDINITHCLHEGKEHGVVLREVPSDTQLVIIPDAGSNQLEEHRILKEKGMDVLVLDHHQADKESHDAIIVNNQMCDYPNKNLSGAAIVYKVCKALDDELNVDYADRFLDLVALGLVGDMMDTRELETRYYMKKGLENIRNPFFLALYKQQKESIRKNINIINVAFYIVPCINACIRIGTNKEKEDMFLAFIGRHPSPLSVAKTCRDIKDKQDRLRDNGLEIIENMIADKELNKNKAIIIDATNIINRPLTGLIANQVRGKYKKPTIILQHRGNNVFGGSARGCDIPELRDFKLFLNRLGIFNFCEGHANAFGIEIKKEYIDTVINILNEKLKNVSFDYVYVDFIIPFFDISPHLIKQITNLRNEWGQEFQEPLLAIEGIEIERSKLKLIGKNKNVIKFLFNDIEFIKFKSSEDEYKNIVKKNINSMNIIGRCSLNEWQGKITPQIFIEDYEVIN